MSRRTFLVLTRVCALGLLLAVLEAIGLAQETIPQGQTRVRVAHHAIRHEGEFISIASTSMADLGIEQASIHVEGTRIRSRGVAKPASARWAREVRTERLKGRIRNASIGYERPIRCQQTKPCSVTEAPDPTESPSVGTGFIGSSVEIAADRLASTCIVTSTADSGSGTLRWCLETASTGDTITFLPTTFPPTRPLTISLLSPLPTITIDRLIIDASDAGVILDGSRLANGDGFTVDGAQEVAIRGIQITRFPRHGIFIVNGATSTVIGGDRTAGTGPLGQGNLVSGNTSIGTAGVLIWGSGTTSNTILGNFIGTDMSGTAAISNNIGVAIGGGATNNIIGGNTPGIGNLLSGNRFAGISFQDDGTTGNQVLGNYIGTNVSGTVALPNTRGVLIGFGASGNIIGGDTPGARNLISGNEEAGIQIQNEGTSGNHVLGNYIGTNVSGTAAIPNTRGVLIGLGANNNTVGGESSEARNIVSGNSSTGIQLQDEGTVGNYVLGNYIGTDVSGTAAIPNTRGVLIGFGANNNTIGGESSETRNIVSGNSSTGIQLQDDGTTGSQVLGNYIGTNVSGTVALPNTRGVLIGFGASGNIIGGDTPGARNLISGNKEIGIQIQNDGTNGNRVLGNHVGTDINGTACLGNNYFGVTIGFGAANNVIGGDTPEARNLISGNGEGGVGIQNEGTMGNHVLGNYIGTNISGTAALPNTWGVLVGLGASNNTIGGDTPGARNLISGNGEDGIQIQDEGTTGNLVMGNLIGIAITGNAPLSNHGCGVVIGFAATGNTIGGDTPGACNIISANRDCGVAIQGEGTASNEVLGNLIGTDVSGTALLGNTFWGIAIGFGAANNTIGGDTPGARNLISGNGDAGVVIQHEGTTGNQVLGNLIGTDATGTAPIPNGSGVDIGLGASSNIVGGDTPGAGNLISGNGEDGITIEDVGTAGNQVVGNFIGTDASGNAPLPNDDGVVILEGASDNIVGGDTFEARNLISGNGDVGVWIQNAGTIGNQVLGNFIGTNVSGTLSLPNNGGGVLIGFQASGNILGGEASGMRNIISGNGELGVWIQNEGTIGNQVLGNYVGTNVNGTVALPNNRDGIGIGVGASDNFIGGDTPGAGNLISGNGRVGVFIQDDGTTGNRVLGNFIGTDVSGTLAVPNSRGGVVIGSGATDNVIGGEPPGGRNIISGNVGNGVQIQNEGTTGNLVAGNFIGVDTSGMASLPNNDGVVILERAANNLVGGETSGLRNLISGNRFAGITFQDEGTTGNQVLGNYIGTDVSGTAALPNTWGVVMVLAASDNTIGGDSSEARNVISGNSCAGVQLQDEGTAGNHVLGNFIGTNVSGTVALPNLRGVLIGFGAIRNTIGGDTPGARNLISGNEEVGVWIRDEGTTGNQVLGNYIGTNVFGMAALPNTRGVLIDLGASDNTIGGESSEARNVISGNSSAGVQLQEEGTSANRVLGNFIGTDSSSMCPLPNRGNGVFLLMGTSANTIGISNTIVYNGLAGVAVDGAKTVGNTVTRNIIHDNGDLPIQFVQSPDPAPVPPRVTFFAVEENVLHGMACPGCRVEVYSNPTIAPAATTFVGAARADIDGVFRLSLSAPPPFRFVAVCATDENGTTSEFASTALPQFRIYLPMIFNGG